MQGAGADRVVPLTAEDSTIIWVLCIHEQSSRVTASGWEIPDAEIEGAWLMGTAANRRSPPRDEKIAPKVRTQYTRPCA
jgi:hypothetical protein